MERSRAAVEQRLALALEAGRMGTWEWDIASGRLTWSESLAGLHGIDLADFGGTLDDYLALIHPDDREHALAATARTLETHEPHRVEHRIVRPDGSVRWLGGSGSLVCDDDGTPVAMIGVAFDLTETKRVEEELRAETRFVEVLHRVGSALAGELELERLVQAATDAATVLVGADFGGFFYNVDDGHGGSYLLHAISGVDPEAFATFPQPRNTAVFAPTFAGERVVRFDDVTAAEEYGQNQPYRGLPDGHLPVRSYLAVPVVSRTGVVHGGIFLGHAEAGRFDDRHERLVVGIAAQAAIALDNAHLYAAARRAREDAERAATHVARLQDLTAKLLQTQGVSDVASAAVDGAVAALGADRVTVFVVAERPTHLRLVRSSGGLDGPADGCELDAATELPICDAFRSARPVLLETPEQRDAAYPMGGSGVLAKSATYAALPLVIEGVSFGVIGLSWTEPRPLAADERFLLAFADQCAQALDRARLTEAERRARADAEAARERLALVAEASRVLGSATDPDTALDEVARLLVPELADSCKVYPDADAAPDDDVRQVARTGGSWLSPAGDRAVVAVGSAGAVLVLDAPSGRLTAADLGTVEEVASRAAVAIETGRAHRAQIDVAQTLQQSLLPPRLLSVPGLEVAARYHAYGDRSQVGGDFYDVFRIGGGRWGVVIGDVSGKGVTAATMTALARWTVRSAALREPTPSAVLRLLNQAVLDQADDDRFCTVLMLLLEPGPEGVHVTMSCGGHPAPYVLRATGDSAPVEVSGSAMGLTADPDLVDVELVLRPGETLVLYTDGLTEARTPDGRFAEGLLDEVLPTCAGSTADEIAATVDEAVLRVEGGLPRDDMAVLVLRLPPGGPAERRVVALPEQATGSEPDPAPGFDRRYPATRASVSAARHEVRAWLRAETDATEDDVDEMLVVVTETATNAARAARTGYRVRARMAAGGLELEVADDGTGFQGGFRHRAGLPDATAEGGRGLFIVEALSDGCDVRTSDAGTFVRLFKRFREPVR